MNHQISCQPSKILRKFLITGLTSLSFLVSGAAYSGQLEFVNNGSFESVADSVTNSTRLTSGTSKLSGWTVGNGDGNGYTFLAYPGTAGTSINGTNGIRLWDKGNGGLDTIPASSQDGGKFIVSDGAYQLTMLYQTISGLHVGQLYQLKFYQAAAQQTGYTGDTVNQWKVSFGGSLTTTKSITLPNGQVYTSSNNTTVISGGQTQYSHILTNKSMGFSPWESQTMTFRATASTQLLGFMALGGPLGQPPFSLLDGVSLTEAVPEPNSLWLLLSGTIAFSAIQRRKVKHAVL